MYWWPDRTNATGSNYQNFGLEGLVVLGDTWYSSHSHQLHSEAAGGEKEIRPIL